MDQSVPAIEAVVIGASAGALDALLELLPALPKGFRPPIMIVVHIPPEKDCMLAQLVGQRCELEVREAADKEPIHESTVYFAPPDYHLLVEKNGVLSLSSEEAVRFSRPSIDVLFETAADVYGDRLAGVVLTGGNDDGARGLRAIHDRGGIGLVQSRAEASVPAMPTAALRRCPEAKELALAEIAKTLQLFSPT